MINYEISQTNVKGEAYCATVLEHRIVQLSASELGDDERLADLPELCDELELHSGPDL